MTDLIYDYPTLTIVEKFRKVNQQLNDAFRKKIKNRKVNEEGEPRDFIEGYIRALKENKNLDDYSLAITNDFFQVSSLLIIKRLLCQA